MDDFREWLSDNLRYILLGLAIIVILVIAFFAVRLISSKLGDNKPPETEKVTETAAPSEEVSTEPVSDTQTQESLQTENQAIMDLVTAYYHAVADKNMEEVRNLCESLDEESERLIQQSPIESYNNIKIYFKKGLTENSYNVYPYYEAKMPNIDELVPSLTNLYVETKEDGSLYVVDSKSDEEVAKFMEQSREDSDVQELIASVHDAYNTVVSGNADLQAAINDSRMPETEIDIPDADSVDVHVDTPVTVTDHLNVRADSRQDSEQIGSLIPGQVVTRIEILDNGWSKIRMDDGAGTIIEGYVLSEYLQE